MGTAVVSRVYSDVVRGPILKLPDYPGLSY